MIFGQHSPGINLLNVVFFLLIISSRVNRKNFGDQSSSPREESRCEYSQPGSLIFRLNSLKIPVKGFIDQSGKKLHTLIKYGK
jgi:hypothetical protein